MQTTTTELSGVIAFPTPAPQASEPARAGGYNAVRFNALKHGVLSRHTVLVHEDANEFADLMAALAAEHQPAGPTETHLVEELAAAIWRKRRVLQAEGASINQGLKGSVRDGERVIPSAAPFEAGLSGKGTDIRDLVGMTPEEVAAQQRDAKADLVDDSRGSRLEFHRRIGIGHAVPGHFADHVAAAQEGAHFLHPLTADEDGAGTAWPV